MSKSNKSLLSFEGFTKKEDFNTALHDFLQTEEAKEILKSYHDDVYIKEEADKLSEHDKRMRELKDSYKKDSGKFLAEIEVLEEKLDEKQKYLDMINEDINRQELARQYLQRNDVFKGRKNTLEERMNVKMKELEEAKKIKSSDANILNEDVITNEPAKELSENQKKSLLTYFNSTEALLHIEEQVRNGINFEEAVFKTGGIDRSRCELIVRGAKKLEEGIEALRPSHMVEHLIK